MNRWALGVLVAATVAALFASGLAGVADRDVAAPTPVAAARPAVSLDAFPLLFVENLGQTDPRATFYARGRDLDVFLTARGLTYALGRPGDRFAVRADFLGAAPVKPEGAAFAPTVVSFFKGPKEQWKTGARTCREVAYRGVWPGIDLTVSAAGDGLKSLYVVAPGADASRVAFRYEGPESVRVTERGELLVSTPAGSILDGRPVAWQVRADGGREEVAAAYEVSDAGRDAWRVGFALGAFDPSRTLFLDPVILTYSGFFGTGSGSMARGIAVDTSGRAYLVGTTMDAAPAFPATGGPDTSFNGDSDAFVAKISADGYDIQYAGYIGGAAGERGMGIAVDSSGNAYVVGQTYSNQTTFPVVDGPDLSLAGMGDAFVAKVTSNGTSLVYCGYVGGDGDETGYAVALDGALNAYVVGNTFSTEATFPVTAGPDTTYNGGTDGFIAKVTPNGKAFGYVGYVGGSSFDEARAVAVEPGSGVAYVVGSTQSSQGSFPVLNGPDLTYNGGYDDAYVVKVKADGTGFSWAGYLGGTSEDLAFGVAIAPPGTLVVAGRTHSDAVGFPAVGGPDLTLNGDWDIFVTTLDRTTAAVLWSGFVGGSAEDLFGGLGVDDAGDVYVAGYTYSMDGTFPVAAGPSTLPAGGSADAWVTKVRGDGTGLVYSGFVGGGGMETMPEGGALAVSGIGHAFLTIAPGDPEEPPPFPVKTGPVLTPGSASAIVKVSVVPAFESRTKKGALKDSTKPGGDSIKVSGTIPVPVGYAFDPRTLPAELRLGGLADPLVVTFPAGAGTFKSAKGKLSWKVGGASLKMDFTKGTFSLSVSKTDFPSLQQSPIWAWIDLGGQTFATYESWTEDAKRPGSFKFP